MNQNYKNIIYEVEEGVARISINKPPLNVLDVNTIKELVLALQRADINKSVFVIVITGMGEKAFSAGVDISAHLPDKVEKTLDQFHKMFHTLFDLRKPTIAMVNGFALGGGCELAMACDMVVASDNAELGQPEIKVGAIATVATALLHKLIGRKQAFKLLFTGDTISAKDAEQMGLINNVVPIEKLNQTVEDLISKLREKSPIVLQILKRTIYQSIDKNFTTALSNVTEAYLNELIKTEDAVEGLKAFIEKRKPEWKGR